MLTHNIDFLFVEQLIVGLRYKQYNNSIVTIATHKTPTFIDIVSQNFLVIIDFYAQEILMGGVLTEL